MHIILDSNAIGLNFRMDSTHFESLLDYVHRTESVLVIPEAVRTEILATFNRTLDERARKAESHWNKLHAILNYQQEFDSPDADYESERLTSRLDSPGGGISTVAYNSCIDVMEVVRRGAQRIRPANDNGEELRDVVIWLTALEYAKTHDGTCAFISGDKGFWEQDVVHPTIVSDISKAGVTLTLYRDVESFVRANSLSHVELTNEAATKYFDQKLAEGSVSQRIKFLTGFWRNAKLTSTEVLGFEFITGERFEISSDVQLIEATYRCRVQLRASTSVTMEKQMEAITSIWNKDLNSPIVFGGFHNSVSDALSLSPSFNSYVADGSGIPEPRFATEGIEVTGMASFSLRVVSDCIQKLELDDFIVEHAEELRIRQ